MMILNDPDVAKLAASSGVDRIFVDLEINGKFARQGHKDTLISKHSFDDVERVRKAVPGASLLVRLNPWYEGSRAEIDRAISLGVDILMLPMFKRIDEVEAFCDHVAGRAQVIPLLETAEAAEIVDAVAALPGVTEVYIGLNDLHLSMHKSFMFELLVDGTVEHLAKSILAQGKPFGFGGIARIGEGLLPAEKILAEHIRLGSSSVILSRTFHRPYDDKLAGDSPMNLKLEIDKVRSAALRYGTSDAAVLAENRNELKRIVGEITKAAEHAG
ncbi:aldolase/citrate lyase family protein [Janthinobacterium sp. 17J80-10]|uniref:aldolase/citrate lyase family protein n=1 Tax=Janthinobacterium sp. 17J80-10 TaxID=2497863 RepID=UPI0013E8A8AD|nr:aldolase/citrate lyase family protein [Janthinobacterium sp. 17J80-10]